MTDYTLYLVTDRELAGDRDLLDIITSAIQGGVTCVQLREKTLHTRDFVQLAKRLKSMLSSLSIPLIINDRLDIALACKADGVHFGQSDMQIGDARRIVGRSMIIGVSAESLEDAVIAEQDGADYIGLSPVYKTPTKTDTAPPLGLEGVTRIRQAVKIPAVAIGGINQGNAASVIEAGADGIAVVSAIICAQDPRSAARELLNEVKKGLAHRPVR